MRRIIEEGGLSIVYFLLGGSVIAFLIMVLTAVSSH
jgi:hypothetical protein